MEIFLENVEYMTINLLLALTAVVFGYFMIRTKKTLLKFFYGFIWLIFLPNTAYILLDLVHLYEHWAKIDYFFKPIVIVQYALFTLVGVITFIYALYFFEKLFFKKNKASSKMTQRTRRIEVMAMLLILNFMVGFGAVLGFVLRTNSWHIFTQPFRVLEDTKILLSSPNLFVASLIFGLIANILYFYFSKPILNWGRSIKI